MTTIVTRTGKGSPLTHVEVDTNFTNLNTAKLETAAIPLGTAAAPSISFLSDANTGIFSPGADQLAVATNGVARLTTSTTAISSSLAIDHPLGAVGTPSITFTGDLNTGLYSPGADTLAFVEGGAEAMRIDPSGRLLVGTSTAPAGGNGNISKVVIQGYVGGDTGVGIISLQRGQAASALSTGTELGRIAFNDNGGNSFATITCESDAASGTNDYPGRLVFSITADGGSSPTERMRINSAGALGVGGANFGTTGQALISNGSSAVPTWQDLNTAVFGWDHDNDTYGLYLPGTSISTGSLSGTINIDVQSRMRRCVISNAGVVQYYLDADASTNKSADWLRIVETESLATAYTGAPAAEATNSLLRVGVPAWAAGTFTRGQRVTNGGYLWECVAASSTATPAAGAVASVLDGTDGQVVIEIPAFSVRYGFINGVHTREVRLGCNDGLIAQGFRPHPAFIKTDGTYKSAFYWGAYQAYSDGTNLASVSGQTNTRSLTRAQFRTRAALRGTGWHVQSYLELAAIQTLLVTEYRDYNSQKVLGNGSIEGGTFGVATGLSNSRGNRSGNVYTGGGSSSDFMSYRGIENLYGRAWTWADGINVYERVVYLTNNQSVFADDTSVGYSFYAQVPSGSGSFQKELFPLADVFLPSVVTGASSTTYLADGLWAGSGWPVAFVGGASNNGTLAGAFCLILFYGSGYADVYLGARSAYAAN